MATSLAAYQQLLLKVNRNDSNSNIHIPRGKFVVVYNEQARNWLKDKLKQFQGTDDLDTVSDLLEDDVKLEKDRKHRDHVDFKLPDDFFAFAHSYTIASKDGCTDQVLINWNTKSKNIPVLLNDVNNNPSFEYEETLVSISSKKMKVYFTDFKVDEVYLSYYRLPKPIDIDGYINIEGRPSSNIDPEFSDDANDEILNRCALEIMRNNQNPEGFQFGKDRVMQEQ